MARDGDGAVRLVAIATAQLLALACSDVARAADPIRSFSLEVAAAEAGDAALEQRVYLFRLGCSPELSFCNFQRITLNQCEPGEAGKRAFLPWVDYWSTPDRLKVRQSGEHELHLTVYQGLYQKLPGEIVLTFADKSPGSFEELSGFKSSGFIDDRVWPQQMKPLEYVALPNDVSKVLDCPVLLRGLKHK